MFPVISPAFHPGRALVPPTPPAGTGNCWKKTIGFFEESNLRRFSWSENWGLLFQMQIKEMGASPAAPGVPEDETGIIWILPDYFSLALAESLAGS
jgi:hypothetical protein